MTNTNSQTARGVIFDLDGTLYKMKWSMRPLFFLRLFPHGMRLVRYLKVRDTFGGREYGSGKRLAEALAAAFAVYENIPVETARSWIFGTFYDSFVSIMRYMKGTRAGLPAVLSALKAKGTKLAVLSDFSRIPQRLENLGIPSGLFDTMISCEEEGALKPHPRALQRIVTTWALPLSRLLVIGDRNDTDGEAARACGIRFLPITDSGQGGRGSAKSWKEVAGVLLSL